MSKTVRSSADYTIKTGAGASGSNAIFLDSQRTIVQGSLEVKGTQTNVDSTTLNVEDNFIVVARNNSGPADIDAGIMVERGAANNAAFYWNEGDDVFKAVTTTTGSGSNNAIADTALAKIIAGTPGGGDSGDTVATKTYVDAQVAGGGFNIGFRGDDSAVVAVTSGNSVHIAGATNLSTAATEADTVTITLDSDLTNITSITSDASNGNLTLKANGTGDIVVNDTLTFSGAASTPTASAVTKLYNKTAGGGGTGLYFINSNISSGTEGELISKSKATALAIALG
jgi:hypothetical protein